MPDSTDVDETKIYDQDLINNLKSKFKEWKTGWKEQHVFSGDEFDDEVMLKDMTNHLSQILRNLLNHVL